MSLLVPLYVYPSKEKLNTWRLIEDAARAGRPMKVIINPDNGPGKKVSSTYAANIAKLAAAGADTHHSAMTMLGYVFTEYGKRPIDEVKADVRKWREFYPQVTGFFFDEAASKPDKLAYYKEICEYAKAKAGEECFICLNPGTVCDEGYMKIADCVVIFESPLDSWQKYSLNVSFKEGHFPAWMARYPSDRFAIMILKVGEVVGASGTMTAPTPALIDSVGRKALESANFIYMNPKWEGKSSYPVISGPYWGELLKLVSGFGSTPISKHHSLCCHHKEAP